MLNRSAEVTVVGGGIAGLMTANRLAQLGMNALVLEQGKEDRYLCNTRYTGGTFHVCLLNIMSDEGVLKEAIVSTTSGFVKENLAQVIAHEGRRAVRWLQDEGVRFMKASGADVHNWVLAPPSRNRPGLDWEGRAGDVLLRTLEANLIKRGSRVERNTKAVRLVIGQDRCVGVVAQQANQEVQYLTRAVDATLVKQYICAHPERLKQRGAGTGCGDGLRMAMSAGAKAIGMDRFFGHVMSRDSMTNDKLWPYPYGDSLATAGTVVNADGERFANEGRGGVYIANAIAQLEDPFSAAIIFDQTIWEGPGRNGFIPANPHLPAVGGTMFRAADLESLARQMNVAPDRFTTTIANYNKALESGRLALLTPPRRASRFQPRSIAVAPFYAVPVCPGITNTMGGIGINEHAQGLSEDDSPIPGLYVVGSAAGGLTGGPEVGYVGGLSLCGVTGLRAAEHIASARA